MKKDDLIIVIIGLLLLAAVVYTIFFGGNKSRHGVGMFLNPLPAFETKAPVSAAYRILFPDHRPPTAFFNISSATG